jgi:hypothetical protein
MACLHFTCAFTWQESRGFFLWHGDPDVDREACADGVELDSSGRIPTFVPETGCRLYAEDRGYDLQTAPVLHYDLDALIRWCDAPSASTLDVSATLDAWNLFGDTPGPTEVINLFRTFDGWSGALYEKLFFAQNLSAVTPPSEHYTPTWSIDELRKLAQVLRLGLAEFASRLKLNE